MQQSVILFMYLLCKFNNRAVVSLADMVQVQRISVMPNRSISSLHSFEVGSAALIDTGRVE